MNIARLKCPHCGYIQALEIPNEAQVSLPAHICICCNELIIAPKDACCIFCEYSDKKCGQNKPRIKYLPVFQSVKQSSISPKA